MQIINVSLAKAKFPDIPVETEFLILSHFSRKWEACRMHGKDQPDGCPGSTPGRGIVGNDLVQVVHTNVPLFTEQYNLVPCKGFHVNVPSCLYVAANGMCPMNKGSIVVAVLQRSNSLRTAI